MLISTSLAVRVFASEVGDQVMNSATYEVGEAADELTVTPPQSVITITGQPQDSAAWVNSTTWPTLTTTAHSSVSTATLSYQWFTYHIADGTSQPISGANTPSYTPSGLNTGEHYYTCEVTDSLGATAMSNRAKLTVFQPTLTTSGSLSLTGGRVSVAYDLGVDLAGVSVTFGINDVFNPSDVSGLSTHLLPGVSRLQGTATTDSSGIIRFTVNYGSGITSPPAITARDSTYGSNISVEVPIATP